MRSDGTVYFTDPSYGIEGYYEGFAAEPEQAAQHVFKLDPITGTLSIAVADMQRPNGLAFSPDERVLYVSDTGDKTMRAFDVADDGQLTNGREFAKCTVGGFDGFRLDEQGHIWSSAGDGVHVLHPDGTLIGKVKVPEGVANVAVGRLQAQPPVHLRHHFLVRGLAYRARSEDDVAVVDLHVHYPMHLLGGVESPRDVAEQMLKVRAREAGKIRAAILNVAARLFNFRHWDGDWRVSCRCCSRAA